MDRNIWTQLFYLPVTLTTIALVILLGMILFILALVIVFPWSIWYIIVHHKRVLK